MRADRVVCSVGDKPLNVGRLRSLLSGCHNMILDGILSMSFVIGEMCIAG